jgi:hypothetical protein
MTKKSDKMNEREEMDEQTLGDELLLWLSQYKVDVCTIYSFKNQRALPISCSPVDLSTMSYGACKELTPSWKFMSYLYHNSCELHVFASLYFVKA